MKNKNENGVALLLALGFAALLLVLVMGFATNSLIERKAAGVNAERSQSKLIAESALNRAIAAMQYQMQMQTADMYDAGIYRFDNIVSKQNAVLKSDSNANDDASDDSPWNGFLDVFRLDGSEYYLATGKSSSDGKPFYAYTYPLHDNMDYSYNLSTPTMATEAKKLRQPQWQYVKDGNKIVGRFMYAVLPDMGKIPKTIKAQPANSRRLGASIDELDLENMQINMQTIKNRYDDTDYMVEQKFSGLDQSLAFFARNMVEMQKSESELNAKFSNGTTNKDMLNLSAVAGKSVTELQDAIPFLKKIGTTEVQRNQITANLIDFCDTNLEPTTDLTPANNLNNWDGASGTYSGNEKTPYINELKLEMAITATVAKAEIGAPPDEQDQYTFTNIKATISTALELVNYFGAESDKSFAVKSTGSGITVIFQKSINGGTWTDAATGTLTKKLEDVLVSAVNKTTQYPTFEANFVIDGNNFIEKYPKGTPPNIKFRAYIESVGGIIFDYDGKSVDFVKDLTPILSAVPENDALEVSFTASASGNVTTPAPKILDFEVNDARLNLDNAQWQKSEASTIGIKNNFSNWTAADIDFKTGTTEAEVLEYCKKFTNGTPESLADLGRIHRGEPWRTLNISKAGGDGNSITNNNTAASSTTFTTSYTEGDGGLLDQVTVMNDATPQLIDINTRSINIWRALLTGIKDNQDTPALIFTTEQVKNLAQNISNNIRSEKLFFKSRSAVLRPIKELLADNKNNDGTQVKSLLELSGNTDWSNLPKDKKDSFIGNFISLCKTEPYPEFVQVFVVAQTIKDAEGNGAKGKFDAVNDTILSEAKFIAKLQRIAPVLPATKPTFKVLNIEYLID